MGVVECLKNGTCKQVSGNAKRLLCFDTNGCQYKSRFFNPKENCFECMQVMEEKINKSRELPPAVKLAWGMDAGAKRNEFAEFDLL